MFKRGQVIHRNLHPERIGVVLCVVGPMVKIEIDKGIIYASGSEVCWTHENNIRLVS